MKKILFLLFLVPSMLWAQKTPQGATYDAKIVRVNDGDTVVIAAPFLPAPLKPELAVRIYGVDTPEKGFRAQCPSEDQRGQAAWSNVANSVVQTVIHSNTISDGTVVYAGLNSSRDEVEIGEDIKKRLQLWRTANGTPSTLTLAVSYTATNADLLYKLGWEELIN